jgi:hypothetical protein
MHTLHHCTTPREPQPWQGVQKKHLVPCGLSCVMLLSWRNPAPAQDGQALGPVWITATPPKPPPKAGCETMDTPPPCTVPRPWQPLQRVQKKHFWPGAASCVMVESWRHPLPLHDGQACVPITGITGGWYCPYADCPYGCAGCPYGCAGCPYGCPGCAYAMSLSTQPMLAVEVALHQAANKPCLGG